MSVIRALAHLDPTLCRHCLKKLTNKEMYLFGGYCTKCWRLRGGRRTRLA
nr:MAG TPA: ubiquitin protein ligase [Caudoviricetes sp.]